MNPAVGRTSKQPEGAATEDPTGRRLRDISRVVGVLTVVLLIVALGTYLSGNVDRLFANISQTTAALLGAVNCALAARRSAGRVRLAWGGLAVACLSWGFGQAVWSWYEMVQHTATPFPGLADVGYLGFPIGAVLALAIFPANASRGDRRRMTLDAILITCAIGLVSWGTVLGAVVEAGGDSVFATAVAVAYPLSDIMLLVVCVLVLSRARAYRVPLAFLAFGLLMMTVADSGFAYLVAVGSYATGSMFDLGWFFAFGTLAFASLAPGATSSQTPVQTPTVAGAVLPYIPLGGAFAFIAWRYATGHDPSTVDVVMTGVMVLLVVIRQFFTVRYNQQLALVLAQTESELRHQAFHDQLTGLANRALFVDRLAHALELHRRDRRPLAICFLDLDGFKAVNDKLGHSAGDDLLKGVSARFGEVLSGADTLARFGGDEFAVLLEDRTDAGEIAHELLGSLIAPFPFDHRAMSVRASIGVARVDLIDRTPTVDELLQSADLAMYVVKSRGGADVLVHTVGLQLEEVDDVELGRALALAVAKNEITVAFQPIIDLSTGRMDTLEVLARWAPDGRPMNPEVFVRVAEHSELIDPLFRFVLAQACDQLARWTDQPGGSDLRVAVNVSPGQLSSPTFPRIVVAELERHGLDGDRLVLDITESGGLMDTAVSLAVCHELRRLGIRLSVDDFGTGLSSMARLRDLPIDEVKIDRSFITGMDQDTTRYRFVAGVLAFADRLGITVVAEGIEREAERDALTDLGCHRAQGFLFSKAVPAEVIDSMLASPGSWLRGIPSPQDASP